MSRVSVCVQDNNGRDKGRGGFINNFPLRLV